MRIGDEKILVTHCRFGKDFVEVNKRFSITQENVYDSEENKYYNEINIHGIDYECKSNYNTIVYRLEEM